MALTVEVLVGRSSWSKDQEYRTLLPAYPFMTPAECKEESNKHSVQLFKTGEVNVTLGCCQYIKINLKSLVSFYWDYCKTRKNYDDKISRKCSKAVFTTIKIYESSI